MVQIGQTATKFKVGDTVECVDNKGFVRANGSYYILPRTDLTLGRRYVVDGLIGSDICVGAAYGSADSSRFKLAKDEIQNAIDNPPFNVTRYDVYEADGLFGEDENIGDTDDKDRAMKIAEDHTQKTGKATYVTAIIATFTAEEVVSRSVKKVVA